MTTLIRALNDCDRSAFEQLLADDVAFNSPVRTYRERADVIHLLTTLGGLLGDVRTVREWSGPDGAATVVSVGDGDDRLDGVIEELHGADGRVVEVTLMLRPLGTLLHAVKRMGRALERSPLPSGTTLTDS